MENLQYLVTFKRVALTNKITVTDSSENIVTYSHQKLLKIKEKVLLFADQSKTQPLGEINADSIIDFNVKFTLTDENSAKIYSLKRLGKKSLWKANYKIYDSNETLVARINEKNPWAKVMDTLFGAIPIIGIFTGYVFQVEYAFTNPDGQETHTIKKRPALIESKYEVHGNTDQVMPLQLMHITLMALMRERFRS